jgi:hypothetical protein
VKLGGLMSYGLVLLGTGIIGLAVAQAMSSVVNYAQGRLLLVNLLRTNPARAEATCRHSRGTFYEAIGSALTTGAQTGSRDPNVIVQGTRPSFDAASQMIGIKTKMLLGKIKLGAMSLGGGMALALSSDSSLWFHILFTLIGIAGAGWLWFYKQNVDSSLMRAKGEILPEVERALAEGRYIPGQQ